MNITEKPNLFLPMKHLFTILSFLLFCSCTQLHTSLVHKNQCNQNKRYKGQLQAKEPKLRQYILLMPKTSPKEENF